ncbi:hypothetical protein FT993_09590 [Mesonia sp. HuA40]|nr:hypothetical protein FT993_09590 [Mesonia sp. HuA40]
MKYFVYIIYSESYDSYYRGYSTQPEKRLKQHNEDKGINPIFWVFDFLRINPIFWVFDFLSK